MNAGRCVLKGGNLAPLAMREKAGSRTRGVGDVMAPAHNGAARVCRVELRARVGQRCGRYGARRPRRAVRLHAAGGGVQLMARQARWVPAHGGAHRPRMLPDGTSTPMCGGARCRAVPCRLPALLDGMSASMCGNRSLRLARGTRSESGIPRTSAFPCRKPPHIALF